MKKSIKRVSKRALSIVLTILLVMSTMLIGVVTTHAITTSGGRIYFAKPSTWTGSYTYFMIGNSGYTDCFSMTKVSNTSNLYYYNLSSSWDNATGYCFINSTSSWNGGNFNISDNYSKANHYTNLETSYGLDNTNSIYVAAPASGTNGVNPNVSYKGSALSGLNSTQTISVRTATGSSSSYTTPSTSPATVKLTGYYFNSSYTSLSSHSVTLSGSAVANSATVGYLGNATLTCTNVDPNYTFEGWYNTGGTRLSANTSYTYNPTATTTIYARFKESNFTVSAKPQKMTFDVDSGRHNSAAAGSDVGTATVTPTSVSPGANVNLTANVTNSKYTFAGWYTSSSCTGTVAASTATATVKPTGNTTYYALFKETPPTQYELSVESNPDVTVSAKYNNTTVAEGSNTLVYAGGLVTVTVTGVPAGKDFEVTVEADKNVNVSGSGSTYTFKMPESAATVKVLLTDKPSHKITVQANNNAYGSVTASKYTAYEGDTVTLTATAKSGYSFSNWDITGTTITSSQKTTKSITITVKDSDITATANFADNAYHLVVNGSEYQMARLSNGLYFSTHAVSNGTADGDVTTKGFNIKRTSDNKYANSGSDSAAWWITKEYIATEIKSWDTSNDHKFLNNTGSTKYVVFDPNGGAHGQVYLTGDSGGKLPITIYATDGSVGESTSDTNYTAKYGDTVLVKTGSDGRDTVVTPSETSTYYNTYSGTEGSVIKVRTTINSTYSSKYYVHAFVVNGNQTYLAENETGSVYTAEIPIEVSHGNVEITPIYYLNDCKTAGKYITIYVDLQDTITDQWDETVAGYSYYYTSSDTSYHADGDWPGQPLLYNSATDRYYCRVPREMNGTKVSGITVNNYNGDKVHSQLFHQNSNLQTYDYAAFKRIADLGADVIMFEIHPRYNDAGDSSTNKSLIGNTDVGGTVTLNNFANHNGWNNYTDMNGAKVDPLGNPTTSSSKKAYIVSTAPHDLKSEGVGEFATIRYVFDANGKCVAKGIPADFIPRPDGQAQTEAYQAVENAGLVGATTQISYESVVEGRCDGRWYYQAHQSVTADVKVQTSEDGSVWSAAAYNASAATIDGKTSVTFDSTGQTASLLAKAMKGYVFKGWGTTDVNGENFRELPATLGNSFEATIDTDVHYIARFVKAGEGQLVLSHRKYAGEDAKGGIGYYFISATVQHQGGTSEPPVSGTGTGSTGQAITLDKILQTDIIKVTLTTTTSGDNTFRYWYLEADTGVEIIDDPDGDMTHNGTPTSAPFGLKGTLTYTFEIEAWKLFSGNNMLVSELNYYSDIAPVSKDYVLTYKYVDRFGNERSYVVKGTHDDQYFVDNGSWAPTEALIYEKAPAIDDFNKDCTWLMSECSFDGSSATVRAVQNEKYYHVKIYDAEGLFNEDDVELNGYLLDKNTDDFYFADDTYEDQPFSYWEVKENGKEVARHYFKYFNLKIAGDYEITPIYGADAEDKLYISDAHYSREQFTDASGVHDYVYADFIISFLSSNGALLSDHPEYKTGVLVEACDKAKVGETEEFDSDIGELERAAKDDTTKHTYHRDADSSNRVIFDFKADNSKFNNMNRLDFYVQFDNTPNNRTLLLKAYYYVVIDGQVTLSEPVYFNFSVIGNSTPTTG